MARSEQEIELKFALSSDEQARLARTEFAGVAGQDLLSIYFDTPHRELHEAGLTLRLRRQDGRWRQTIKAAGQGNVARYEKEQAVRGDRLDRKLLSGSPVAKALGKDFDALAPVFETRVCRHVQTRQVEGGELELALDRGEIVAGADSQPIVELEIELKAGAPALLFAEARRLSSGHVLRPRFTSKAQRGYALVDGVAGEPRRFSAPALAGDTTAQDAFAAVAFACLRQLDANADAMVDRHSLEALHQARVAVRRLRVFIGAFEDMLADQARDDLDEQLQRLAEAMGDARNLDVFIAETFRPEASDDAGVAQFGVALLKAQSAAHDKARQAVTAPAFSELLIRCAEWLSCGDWIEAPTTRALAGAPLEKAAAGILDHRRKAMLKRGKDLDWRDPLARHKLRIQAKKLRYLAEALAPSMGKPDDFLGRLERLQDSLGRLNDIAVSAATAGLALGGAGPDVNFAAGLVVGARRCGSDKLVRQARRRFTRFADTPPFWR